METENNTSLTHLENSLKDSIASENLIESFGALSEALMDSKIPDGILQNIPFFDVLYKLGKASLSVRDCFFAKKVVKFLFEIKEISSEKRVEFLKELNSKTGQKAGEVLMMLIERLDNMEKPKIIANLFIAKVNNSISIGNFLRLSSIVDKAYIYDLKKLNSFDSADGNYIEDVSESLYGLGLLYIVPITSIVQTLDKNKFTNEVSDAKYTLTTSGKSLLVNGIKYRNN